METETRYVDPRVRHRKFQPVFDSLLNPVVLLEALAYNTIEAFLDDAGDLWLAAHCEDDAVAFCRALDVGIGRMESMTEED